MKRANIHLYFLATAILFALFTNALGQDGSPNLPTKKKNTTSTKKSTKKKTPPTKKESQPVETSKADGQNTNEDAQKDEDKRAALEVETEYWKSVQELKTIEAYKSYLKKYPTGEYEALAQIAIRKLEEEQRKAEEQRKTEEAKRNEASKSTAPIQKNPIKEESKRDTENSAETSPRLEEPKKEEPKQKEVSKSEEPKKEDSLKTEETKKSQSNNQPVNSTPPTVNPEYDPSKPLPVGVLNDKAIKLPRPVYTEIARHWRQEGVVIVEVVVDEKGDVVSAKAISGPIYLREPSVLVARKAKFNPFLINGKAVKVVGTISYSFKLN